MTESRLTRINAGGCVLQVQILTGAPRSITPTTTPKPTPTIVLLHDGLGSISLWRDVPTRLAEATGARVVVYDRPGHGGSLPVPTGAWPVDWLAQQADLLVGLLDELDIADPLLVGHSDGGSIALLHAANRPSRASAVLTLAPHSYVEPVCLDAITSMRADPAPIVAGLGRHHDHPVAVFEAWSGGWTRPEFAAWDIRPQLSLIAVPTIVAQGRKDNYATDAMVHKTVNAIGANATGRLLDDVGHLIHRESPETVVDLTAELLQTVG